MKRVQVKDIRQGITLYLVASFPYTGSGTSSIKMVRVQSRPYLLSNMMFFDCTNEYALAIGRNVKDQHSLSDSGIIPNRYNMHAIFHTLKQAQRYAARMDSLCLTPIERAKSVRLAHDSSEYDLLCGFQEDYYHDQQLPNDYDIDVLWMDDDR